MPKPYFYVNVSQLAGVIVIGILGFQYFKTLQSIGNPDAYSSSNKTAEDVGRTFRTIFR